MPGVNPSGTSQILWEEVLIFCKKSEQGELCLASVPLLCSSVVLSPLAVRGLKVSEGTEHKWDMPEKGLGTLKSNTTAVFQGSVREVTPH